MNREDVFMTLRCAAIDSMHVIREYQLGNRKITRPAIIKGYDKTLLTEADIASGEAGVCVLMQLPAEEYDINPEDSIGRATPGARYVVLFDNLDGTRSFNNGLKTSTIIIALYDRHLRKVIFCLIGEPVSGEFRYAWLSDTKEAFLMRFGEKGYIGPVPIQVTKNDLDGQASVFMDAYEQGFPLSLEQYLRLQANIAKLGQTTTEPQAAVRVMLPGSNGLNQALVANGWQGAVGGVTTAMGGPWDAAGVMLVIAAGGFARAFKKQTDGTYVEADPLDPMSYDIVIYGNNQFTVDLLTLAFQASVQQ